MSFGDEGLTLRLTSTTDRSMLWEIVSGKAVYTCSKCRWKLELAIDDCMEPLRQFNQHVCNERSFDESIKPRP